MKHVRSLNTANIIQSNSIYNKLYDVLFSPLISFTQTQTNTLQFTEKFVLHTSLVFFFGWCITVLAPYSSVLWVIFIIFTSFDSFMLVIYWFRLLKEDWGICLNGEWGIELDQNSLWLMCWKGLVFDQSLLSSSQVWGNWTEFPEYFFWPSSFCYPLLPTTYEPHPQGCDRKTQLLEKAIRFYWFQPVRKPHNQKLNRKPRTTNANSHFLVTFVPSQN